ncbi:MAG: sulfite exporter TauE/SafE family protein [Candidatus Daviesbacteria bacterium]|nr:sulfite exporter TauE/SafE family protein [Candidatus Daviesbacteria bacterium]
MDLITIFLVGLTAGGLGCAAVQGGLLASAITARKEVDQKDKNDFIPTLSFLLAKLVSYAILGGVLGLFGAVLSISDNVRNIMQIIAGIYMIIVALNLLNVHPFFRYFILQPPRFLTRMIRNKSKSADIFAPGILGAMTIFIPCGTTLAMEALAISSGSAIKGALILIAFVLGTSPIFFGLGYITAKLSDNFRQTFFKIAAFIIIFVGLITINNTLGAAGFPIVTIDLSSQDNQTQTENIATSQEYQIQISGSGYSPNYMKVKKGLPVKLTLTSNNSFGCALAFRIPSLGISKNLKPTDTQVIEFTPKGIGQIPFSCSMGMYRGTIEVI